jgi:hypothetical protein
MSKPPKDHRLGISKKVQLSIQKRFNSIDVKIIEHSDLKNQHTIHCQFIHSRSARECAKSISRIALDILRYERPTEIHFWILEDKNTMHLINFSYT